MPLPSQTCAPHPLPVPHPRLQFFLFWFAFYVIKGDGSNVDSLLRPLSAGLGSSVRKVRGRAVAVAVGWRVVGGL